MRDLFLQEIRRLSLHVFKTGVKYKKVPPLSIFLSLSKKERDLSDACHHWGGSPSVPMYLRMYMRTRVRTPSLLFRL